ncbi:MAG: histidine--tRNA ligase [Nanoarchaeota archaeon]
MQLAKGTRDIAPEQKLQLNKVVNTLVAVFERFGYVPLETPIIERSETLSSKYAGGEEILKEMFTLKDQGKRELGLRYDLTVPFCRYISMNPELKMPFKRYAMGKVFRDGPIKLGRYREFWQCDADMVGSKSMRADADIILLALYAFKELGFAIEIKINNRKLLNGIMKQAGIKDVEGAILSLDKLEKFGKDAVVKELNGKGIGGDAVKKLFLFMVSDLAKLKILITDDEGKEGLAELEELFSYLGDKACVFDVSLARGLAYYTGTVYEVYLKKSPIKSSVAAGGRYDNMIGQLLGSKLPFPALGISFGLDVLADALPSATQKTTTQLFVIPIGTVKESMKLASFFREKGINTDLDVVGRGISKNLNYVNAKGIPFVVFVGEDELKKGDFKLRDMNSGEEVFLKKEEVVEKLTSSKQ